MSRSELIQARLALRQLLAATEQFETLQRDQFAGIPESHLASARNLAHYLAVRQHDLRPLQLQLSRMGLSSLGRMEGRVESTLMILERLLSRLIDGGHEVTFETTSDPAASTAILEARSRDILGPEPSKRHVRIMVTLPSEAATDGSLCADLIQLGMNEARINCSHDCPTQWEQMARNIRSESSKLGLPCVIVCDLPGPKLRIGALRPGPAVLKWKPKRDAWGRVEHPARIALVRDTSSWLPLGDVQATVPVRGQLDALARPGDVLTLTDIRGKKRTLQVIGVEEGVTFAQAERTTYVTEGVVLALVREREPIATVTLGELPAIAGSMVVAPGDHVKIKLGDIAGEVTETGEVVVGLGLPEVFAAVAVGHRVLIDDGKIEGKIVSKAADEFVVCVSRAGSGTAKLSSDKGINLPDAELELPTLFARDLEALDFASQHADSIALSFVHRPRDIEVVQQELVKRSAGHLGKILKIETRRAFESLPALLFAGLRHPPLAVMVARGDLAVEVGFERLAEVQEEILWLCEAAHVPVIWATQVLESLTKLGFPSRAEVTDAAMSVRAEAVMLNKGPHIRESLQFLSNVLERMQEHQHKKSARLRRLSVSLL